MATEHPKVTAYIPKEILKALDDWKQEKEIDSRSSAVVAIVADYLGVHDPVPSNSTAPLNTILSQVLDEVRQLKERVAALEQGSSTAPVEALSTVLSSPSEPPLSDGPNEVLSAVLVEVTQSTSDTVGSIPNAASVEAGSSISTALKKVPSTAKKNAAPLQAPLTQSALAKRLGCSDKAIEKQRKHGSKENFVAWSRERDPDYIGWTWAQRTRRGQPLRFIPAT